MDYLLTQMGFEPKIYADKYVSDEQVFAMETQLSVPDGRRTSYADSVLPHLEKAAKGDIIIATESWHAQVFRGLLDKNYGRIGNAPVVELWIDYLGSFAHYRVFSSHAVMMAEMGIGTPAWNRRWIVADPYVPCALSSKTVPMVKEPTDPFSTEHLYWMAQGVPVVAPDFAVWHETIQHGGSGFLYRSSEGREKALDYAADIPSATIVQIMSERYSLQKAQEYLVYYLLRVTSDDPLDW